MPGLRISDDVIPNSAFTCFICRLLMAVRWLTAIPGLHANWSKAEQKFLQVSLALTRSHVHL